MPETNKIITNLEKINEIIDLCIDRELFDYLDPDNSQIFFLSKEAKDFIKKFQKDGNRIFEFTGKSWKFPVEKVNFPDELIKSDKDCFQKGPFVLQENGHLLQRWSYLFWAKRIRAELQKKNKKPWIDRFDDLILFLETRMPILGETENSQNGFNEIDFNLTMFNFLMELSAVAVSEASFGYAERARKLLKEIKKKEPKNSTPYDRWLLYNKGIAYQHMGRNKKSLTEFNWLIKKFWEETKGDIGQIINISDKTLEFLLNICPATLQRAEINVKQQLGYHTLQTLGDNKMNACLEYLFEDKEDKVVEIFKKAAAHLQKRVNLIKIEALIQIGEQKSAEKQIEKIYRDFNFKDSQEWKPSQYSLPSYSNKNQNSLRTQMVERIVYWRLENIKEKIQELKIIELNGTQNKKKELIEYIQGLPKIINQINNNYWNWVKGNSFDERIYFSRWAQFLKLTADILERFEKLIQKGIKKR